MSKPKKPSLEQRVKRLEQQVAGLNELDGILARHMDDKVEHPHAAPKGKKYTLGATTGKTPLYASSASVNGEKGAAATFYGDYCVRRAREYADWLNQKEG